ncbi:helix-turn-helix domain-containing protein [Comamonas sp. 4034]|uniref:helix-turn-helix domain-containing protein n=1 Tax=Comamonas sp. 4034 TaxID=3156455 RepID=UPI003D1F3630
MSEKQFKDRLIAARESLGLSQTALANSCDMASTQLARYENGKAVPRRAVMARIAEKLGVSAKWLATGVSEEVDVLGLDSMLHPLTTTVVSDPSGQNFVIYTRPNPRTAAIIKERAAALGLSLDELVSQILDSFAANKPETPEQLLTRLELERLKDRIERLESSTDLPKKPDA